MRRPRPRRAAAPRRRTPPRTRAASPGSTPCPRLTTCPSPPVSSSMARVRRATSGGSPRRRPGSRLPWRARPGTRRRASERATRQSMDRTSAPVSAIVSSRWPQPLTYRMTGVALPPDSGDRAGGGRKRPLAVVLGGELARPGVEELHGVGAGSDLEGEHVRGDVGEEIEELPQRPGVASHHRLQRREAPGSAALDEVGGERPRRPAEAEHRRAAADLPLEPRQDFSREGDLGGGIEAGEPLDRRGGADGLGQRRAAVAELDAGAHGRDGNENVREEDHAVGIEAPEGLEGDFRRQLDRAAELHERHLLPHVPVFGQVAPGLAHHPHRRPVDRPEPAGVEESRSGRKRRGVHPFGI